MGCVLRAAAEGGSIIVNNYQREAEMRHLQKLVELYLKNNQKKIH